MIRQKPEGVLLFAEGKLVELRLDVDGHLLQGGYGNRC